MIMGPDAFKNHFLVFGWNAILAGVCQRLRRHLVDNNTSHNFKNCLSRFSIFILSMENNYMQRQYFTYKDSLNRSEMSGVIEMKGLCM